MKDTLKLVTIMIAPSVTSVFAADWPWLYGPRRDHSSAHGDLLIVAPQTPDVGAVAYDKRTGEIRWKSVALSGIAGYVTPSIVKVAGEDHLVMIAGAVGRGRNAKDGSVNGLDPRSGKLWTYRNWQCIIPVPQAVDAGEGRVLITGAYGAGTAMIKGGAEERRRLRCGRTVQEPGFRHRPSCTRVTSTRTTRSTNAATASSR